jgi:hypothetical protein
MHREQPNQQKHNRESQRGNAQPRAEADGVPRRLRGDEDITADEIGTVAKTQADGRAHGLRGVTAQIRRQHADVDGHLDEGAEGDDELREVPHARGLGLRVVDRPAGDGEADRRQHDRVALVPAAGGEGGDETADDTGDPDRNGHDLGAARGPAELGGDGGVEGGEGAGGHVGAEEEEGAEIIC